MSKERPFIFSLFGFLLILSSLGTQSLAADTVTTNQTIEDGATLVSSLGRFELGFFSPGASKNRYLGIWYKSTPGVIVWVANRNNPITDRGGAFTIGDSGDLVVLNRTKSTIWSSNVSATVSDPVGQLLETGNLVLKDNSRNANGTTESYVWQSFDQPSDTFLPGMKLGWNLKTHRETYLTSWRSVDDPSPGDFTYRLEIQALPQLVIASGEAKKYRTGPWNGFFFGGTPLLQNSVFNLTVVDNNEEVYYTYGLLNNSVLTRSTLNQTGTEQRYLKYDSWNTWTAIYSMPFDMCDNYGHCGANGFCRPSSNPTCLCLVGFATASPENLDLKNWTGSTFTCERKSALDCKKGEGFVKFEVGKFPDMIDFQWNESMNSEECEAACLRNCSCTAYANLNMTGTGKGCMMWSGDLIDAREVTGLIKQELYIRVSASELESLNGSNNKKRMKIIIAASLGTICFIILGIIICAIRRKRKSKASKQSGVEDVEVPLFDFNVVAASTNNFSDDSIIGAGGFGTVYKGKLSTGQEIAVKRLSKGSGQGVEEFRNEVTLIAKLQHRNLVGLLGSCIRGEERMLIYEYMPNKSLDYFLFDHEKGATLLWKERFNIVLGIARGLLYLHQDSKLHVVHRDLKASNILLDSNLNPKISDFGLARIFDDGEKQATTQRVVGTYGYMSPEYTVDGTFSVKSDVFSLGVLLLEIVRGKRNRGFFQTNHHHTLPGHAWLLWKEGRALELVDPVLEDSYVASQVLRCIQVGLLCVQKLPEDRPAMLSVVFMLANEGALLSQPKEPGFFFIERSSPMDSATRKEESFTANALTITVLEGR